MAVGHFKNGLRYSPIPSDGMCRYQPKPKHIMCMVKDTDSKRVDFSGRSVITTDPYINIDQLGVPKKIAMELTIPEEVTPYNIKYLTTLVKNGRDVYPGANFVLRVNYRDGKTETQKIDLKYRKKAIKLNLGDIVERHAINGDYVLFNRQPTLHKLGMMAHQIHVLDVDDANTFRVNVSVCKPYGADQKHR
jgi:DNA-directed RNA polymerase beta' subunit